MQTTTFADDFQQERASVKKDSLPMYSYPPLAHLAGSSQVARRDPLQDITTRFVDLLPGIFQDPIRVRIYEGNLTARQPAQQSADRSVDLEWLRKTLPLGWKVQRTLSGGVLFSNGENKTSWDHPDPNIPRSRYEDAPYWDESNPKFEALSYAWNSGLKTRSILVFNEESDPLPAWQMPITESLFEALKHIRRTEGARTLWIDAISINQASDLEKSDQVQHMGDIYRLARRVVVWLGAESPNSRLALSTLAYLGAQVDYDENLRRWFDPPDAAETGWGDPMFRLPYDEATWTAVEDLLRRPWFRRLWVVQEIQLAQGKDGAYLQCGTDTISRTAFRRALVCLYFKLATLPDSLRWPIIEAYDLVRPKERIIFHRVLEQIVFNQLCCDDRDKIYGILGVTPARFAAETVPDYSETCTAVHVYTSTLVHHAQHIRRFELWGHCSLAGRKIADLPSWVPDWSVRSPVRRQLQPQFAASTSRAHFAYDEASSPYVLKVLGIRCSVVTRATEALPKLLDQASAIDHVRKWEPPELNTAVYKPTGETLRRAYVTTLISGDVAEMWPDRGQLSVAEWEKQDWPGALVGSRYPPPSAKQAVADPASPPTNRTPPVYRALEFCRGRSFFQTNEVCGLGPSGTQAGDVVVVFMGCIRPVVLRPAEDGLWRFLGDAYVHGLEGATAMLGPLPRPWKTIGVGYGVGGRDDIRFLNTETGERVVEDPRLQDSPVWEKIGYVVDGDDPEQYAFFRHQETREVVSYDPRLEPDELEKRGVKLEWFTLV